MDEALIYHAIILERQYLHDGPLYHQWPMEFTDTARNNGPETWPLTGLPEYVLPE
jgi:hypothetical protein